MWLDKDVNKCPRVSCEVRIIGTQLVHAMDITSLHPAFTEPAPLLSKLS